MTTEDAAPAWRVMRQDDNGNRFLVARGLGREEAEELARTFEARGHKQLYWTERDR
ncbi:SPOR domain-containing protein [Kitasatospora sp. NPDC058965]|uniref:SPOR domain-containing protein n=1 Tax=Kitasatospora sp. NPDC058965 TaxID=3346682 RepID=UPI0036944A54